MMAAISPTAGSRCGATRQIWRSLIVLATSITSFGSMALKHRLSLFDKGLGGFPVVGGLAGAGVMEGLGIEAVFQRQTLGVVDVALDVAQRHRWSLRQRHRELARRGLDLGIGNNARHQAERQRFLGR